MKSEVLSADEIVITCSRAEAGVISSALNCVYGTCGFSKSESTRTVKNRGEKMADIIDASLSRIEKWSEVLLRRFAPPVVNEIRRDHIDEDVHVLFETIVSKENSEA